MITYALWLTQWIILGPTILGSMVDGLSISKSANQEANLSGPTTINAIQSNNLSLPALRDPSPRDSLRNLSASEKPSCDAKAVLYGFACERALTLLPRDGKVVSYGRRGPLLHPVHHLLPYTVISCQ